MPNNSAKMVAQTQKILTKKNLHTGVAEPYDHP